MSQGKFFEEFFNYLEKLSPKMVKKYLIRIFPSYIERLKEIKESEKYLTRTQAKIFIICNKTDTLSEQEKRKLSATLKSKASNFAPKSPKLIISSVLPSICNPLLSTIKHKLSKLK